MVNKDEYIKDFFWSTYQQGSRNWRLSRLRLTTGGSFRRWGIADV